MVRTKFDLPITEILKWSASHSGIWFKTDAAMHLDYIVHNVSARLIEAEMKAGKAPPLLEDLVLKACHHLCDEIRVEFDLHDVPLDKRAVDLPMLTRTLDLLGPLFPFS